VPPDHYFSPQPDSPSKPQRFECRLRGERWLFDTDRGVFSPEHVDPGSRLLIEAMELSPGARVLDVGAGYGPIGLVAARLVGPEGHATLVEVNARAAELARANAALNGLANVTVVESAAFEPANVGPQDVVLTNPPVRAGKQVVLDLLARAAATLAVGGRFYLVGHKHLGVKSYEAMLNQAVGEVDVIERGGGYRVLLAIKEEPEGHG
jgi:16S rRNA (guanine1207-N2)-methyltransferase